MYESHFRLNIRPFAAAPQVDRYFAARAIELARQTLGRCLDRAEGIGVCVGPAGTGKSLLLQMLADQFKHRFRVALIANGHLPSRRSLLQAILFEMGLPYRGLDEGELRLSIVDHASDGSTEGLVLLVDEAHQLPLRLVEELRMLADTARLGKPLVRLVLAGSANLEERLASPKLASFAQRISSRCYLESFDLNETMNYVRSQVSSASGIGQGIFTEVALDRIFRATDGIPRLINQVADHALVLAFAGGRLMVDENGIEEAWADLQQLPSPWNETTRFDAQDSSDSVIEFGVLDDLNDSDQDEPQPIRLSQLADDSHDEQEEATFNPLARQMPEIEMVITPSNNPFAETFSEEEAIINPYASIDEHRLQSKRVRSDEGRAINKLLEPLMAPAAPAKAQAAKHENKDWETVPAKATFDTMSIEQMPLLTAGLSITSGIEFPANDKSRSTVDLGLSIKPLSINVPSMSHVGSPSMASPWSEGNLSQPMMSPSAKLNADSVRQSPMLPISEPEMIIVEDEHEIRMSPKAAPAVRRQEYRQLFAQMRRES